MAEATPNVLPSLDIDILESAARENANAYEVSISYWGKIVDEGESMKLVPVGYTEMAGKLVDESIGLHIVEFDTNPPFEIKDNELATLVCFHTHPDSVGEKNMSFVLPSGSYVEGQRLFGDVETFGQSRIMGEYVITALNILSSYGMTMNVGVTFSRADGENHQNKIVYQVQDSEGNWINFDRTNDNDPLLKERLEAGPTAAKIRQETEDGDIVEYYLIILSWDQLRQIRDEDFKEKDFLRSLSFLSKPVRRVVRKLFPKVGIPGQSLMTSAMDFKSKESSPVLV